MFKPSYVIVLLFLIISSCGGSNEQKEKTTSPRIRKSTKISNPTQNQTFVRGDVIPVTVSSTDEFPIDSIEVVAGDVKSTFALTSFDVSIPTQKVGTWRLLVKVYSKGKSETHYRKVIILPENPPQEMTYTIVNTFPHDVNDYTQGLLIKEGFLYESTGLKGSSTFKKKNLKTGETLETINLSNDLFGEGLALINDEFYQLTWKAGQGFVYNLEMDQVRTFNYQVEGWGLTTFGDFLVLTDETEKLYFVEPMSFTIQSEVEAYTNEGKIDSLNELEVIDGLIYANVYPEDYVVIIDPETGEVLRKIDFSGLLSDAEASKANVLNGIALDPETNKIYVTGKLWPKLFEVTIQPNTL